VFISGGFGRGGAPGPVGGASGYAGSPMTKPEPGSYGAAGYGGGPSGKLDRGGYGMPRGGYGGPYGLR